MKKGFAVAAVLMGSVVYGLQPLFLKNGSAGPMSDLCCTFIRFLACTVLTGIVILVRGGRFQITRRQCRELALFGIFGYGFTNYLMFLAFKTISVTVGIMCNYVYPVLVLLAMTVFFKEKCTKLRLAAVASCIVGLLLIIVSDGQTEPVGVALALLSAVTYAAYIVANEKGSFGKLDGWVIVFYIFLFTAIFFGGYTAVKGELHFQTTAPQLMNNLLSAVTCVISIGCLTYGIKILGASVAAFFCMSEPVTSVLMDIFLLHADLGIWGIAGTVLILLAVLFIAESNRREEKRAP